MLTRIANVGLIASLLAGCQTWTGPKSPTRDFAFAPIASPEKPRVAPKINSEEESRLVIAAPPSSVPSALPSTKPNDGDRPALITPTNEGAGVSLRSLHQRAAARFASMDTYTMRFKRREAVGASAKPEEVLEGKFRREPFSVYFKWVGEEGKGREVCYVQGQNENLIHTLMAPGDLFLFGGKVFRISPDSSMVKSKCRYPITEAGLGSLIDRFGRLVAATEKGDVREGSADYVGRRKRPEFDEPVDVVLQVLAAKNDPSLPRGGQRFWHFDAKDGLPVLVLTLDETGREVEYYCHDRIVGPAHLDGDHFNPDKLWKGR